MIIIFVLLLLAAFIMALISMRDLGVPQEIIRLIAVRRHKGSFVFFKDKVKHYSSSSKSSR